MSLFDGILDNGVVKCSCRDFNNYVEYVTTPVSLEINVDSYLGKGKKFGVINGWLLHVGDLTYSGWTKEDLINKFKWLISKYNLYKKQGNTKRVLCIWTNNIKKIYGFFYKNISENLKGKYIELCEMLEFRDIRVWNDNLGNSFQWNNYIRKELYEKIFIPAKYWYISPNQIIRKQIRHACPKEHQQFIKDMFPKTFNEWKYLRKAFFNGLCVSNYSDIIVDEFPILGIDLTSAYIYSLTCRKHVMSKGKIVNPATWEQYINTEDLGSLGEYEITFTNETPLTNCYKDIYGLAPSYGKQKRTYVMNNIDLKIFMKIVTIHDIKCKSLKEFKLDYLPKYVRDVIMQEYAKKAVLKSGTEERRLQKVKVCGIYGDTIKRLDSIQEFYEYRKSTVMIPHWGIWTTSYTKELLIELANQVEDWLYSDTDSIYCRDSIQNRQLYKQYNEKIRNKVQFICNKFNYNFDLIKGLGEFKLEVEAVKFKSIDIKAYMYTTKDGEFITKAAGCDKKYQRLDDSLYEKDYIPLGKVLFQRCTKDTYYEFWLRDEAAQKLLIAYSNLDTFLSLV